ncbi:MAG TPA: hypothetical protein VHI50_07100 [Micromonosporaceae bacterium]|jgi:hypothetical protein|nr:hypothetical protein [Micromonosporaceae bacterium]
MKRLWVPLVLILPLLAAGACARAADPAAVATPPAGVAGGVGSSAPAAASSAPAVSPTAAAGPAVVSHRQTYGWGVPSNAVLIAHTVSVPIAPPPAPPLPYLEAIGAGDHPEGDPAYARMTFTFRGAFPSYRFGYVREVLSEGSGERVALSGNAFLQVRFSQAQAHDEAGGSSVERSPAPRLGLGPLVSYGFGGDFEGYLTYGLGLRVAPDSDQAPRIRTGELVRGTGADRQYVVYVDVARG